MNPSIHIIRQISTAVRRRLVAGELPPALIHESVGVAFEHFCEHADANGMATVEDAVEHGLSHGWWRMRNPPIQAEQMNGHAAEKAQPTHDAPSILIEAADCISNRAALRDQASGERSMARTVAAFNAMKGTRLTEVDGWDFMGLLKMSRAQGGRFHMDDFIDRAAYAALAGEAAFADSLK